MTTTATANRSEAGENASSNIPRALEEVASLRLLGGRHRLHVQRDLQNGVISLQWRHSLLVRSVMRDNGCPIAETEARRRSILASKVTSTIHRDISFVAIVKSALNFRAAFEKEHGTPFLGAGGWILSRTWFHPTS